MMGFLAGGLVQVALAVQQYRVGGSAVGIDSITAGFGPGTANLLGYFCGLVVIVCLCLALVGSRYRYLLLVPPVGAAWVMASGTGSYLAFGLCAGLLLVISRDFRRPSRLLLFAMVGLAGLIALRQYVESHFQFSLGEYILGPVRVINNYNIDNGGNPGRLKLFSRAVSLIAERDDTLLIGVGTGSVGTLLGPGVVNSNFQRLADLSGAEWVSASFVQVVAELGFLGLLMVLVWFALLLYVAWRAWLRSPNRFERAWRLATLVLVPYVVLAGFGEQTWTFRPVMFPFVILAAYATMSLYQRHTKREGGNPPVSAAA
jgi:O-antigen ligase